MSRTPSWADHISQNLIHSVSIQIGNESIHNYSHEDVIKTQLKNVMDELDDFNPYSIATM